MKKTWWKEAVIYQIYPRSFKDSNGDGVGDIRGIIEKLDYIKDLGIDLVWLGPVYQSPNDDNGYDISDYYEIMDEFGTMQDFDELLEGLHKRGIKLLMDLVVNHSSDEHKWFRESRKSKDNPHRDYYYWRQGKKGGPPNNWPSFFGGSAWELDELTGEYYLHLFSKKQPDLNWENEKLRRDIYEMMKFWLDKGIDGFRMDVIPLISKKLEFEDADLSSFGQVVEKEYAAGPRLHEFIQEMNKEVLSKYDIVSVGEGPGVTTENALLYVGEDRNELNMIFQLENMFFDHGPKGRFDPRPFSFSDLKKCFLKWDSVMGTRGWNNIFLDNHDFPRMVSRFGNDGKYHNESAKLLAVLLLTLRGTPTIYMGSEIGMTNIRLTPGECRDIETLNFFEELKNMGKDPSDYIGIVNTQGRDNVRTPMQWDASPQSGFTRGIPWIKVNPNYREINVDVQLKEKDSILNFYKRMLAFRKSHSALIYGDLESFSEGHEQLYVYGRKDEDEQLLIVLNFSDEQIEYELPITDGVTCLLTNYTCECVYDRSIIEIQPWEARVFSIEG